MIGKKENQVMEIRVYFINHLLPFKSASVRSPTLFLAISKVNLVARMTPSASWLHQKG